MSFRHKRRRTAVTTMHMLETAEADIAYDVHGPLPTADGRPPLLMIAQPMDAGGFAALASHFPDRTVVTYDPRGIGRSIRKDGRDDHSPTLQARDVHVRSDRAWAIWEYRPARQRLGARPTRIAVAAGAESEGTSPGRASEATA